MTVPHNKRFEQTNGARSEMMAPFAAQPRRSADGGMRENP